MSSEIRKRIKTRVGLFFTSLEMRERVEVRGSSLTDRKHGPFVGVYPERSDCNVFEPFRNRGIENQLLEEAEKRVWLLSEIVTLGVGLHLG